MKIKSKFADGKVAEIEVSEEVGTLYLEMEREEKNVSEANAALESVRLANSTARYLFRGISDPDITAQQSHLYIKLLTLTLFALIAAGVQTLLCWAMNTWLVSAST